MLLILLTLTAAFSLSMMMRMMGMSSPAREWVAAHVRRRD
jgi:hypothetical protein